MLKFYLQKRFHVGKVAYGKKNSENPFDNGNVITDFLNSNFSAFV